jgi:cyclopropane-fatty-acyl-phospholipid synthase
MEELVRPDAAVRTQTSSNGLDSAASTPLDRWALARIQRSVATAPLRFMLWDGYELAPPTSSPVSTIVFRNRRALFSWVWNPHLYFGEAYMFGAVEIRGDLVATLEAVYRALASTPPTWWQRHDSNSVAAAKENVHHHYDLGNDFYRLWLDEQLVYTCAYFLSPEQTLEQAQLAKMDLVCRKLALQPGERVIEAGCGWGALALFMAKHYGASVTALNVSTEQVAYARGRARDQGLDGRVEFVLDDYRNMTGRYDVFVSVGMLEHVGAADFPTFGRVIDRTLAAGGRGFLHFIGRNQKQPLNPWIRKRIFPGAYPPTLSEVFEQVFAPCNLSVLDVENLRLHYAKTLEHWRQRFDESADRVIKMFDETFLRAWRLYLAGSQAAFTTGSMQLFQVLFARGSSNDIPWTRFSGYGHTTRSAADGQV